MRILTDSVEYLIRCPCGVKIVYGFLEANNQLVQCPKCLLKHQANKDKPIITYNEAKVHYNSEKENILALRA